MPKIDGVRLTKLVLELKFNQKDIPAMIEAVGTYRCTHKGDAMTLEGTQYTFPEEVRASLSALWTSVETHIRQELLSGEETSPSPTLTKVPKGKMILDLE